jgi:hypothetical protein
MNEGDDDPALQREQRRQQALLQALWQPQQQHGSLTDWLRAPGTALTQRGLQAYAANAGASAERALAASFPTVQALVGDEAFAGLARACWRALPPERGDLACFGAALPGFIEADTLLADVPYLADCARLPGRLRAPGCLAGTGRGRGRRAGGTAHLCLAGRGRPR